LKVQYMARIGIFLIVIALIAGVAGCELGPDVVYSLYISSTAGGSVTTPGEGQFSYLVTEVVNLVAQAEEGYHFVEWTGDVASMNDTKAAATNITMWGDYEITANFAPGIPVWDWHDLDAVRDSLSGNYTLMNDLDSATAGYEELASPTADGGKGWEPIGAWNDTFSGAFDGHGYAIEDLFINRPEGDMTGLFSFVGEAGAIRNVGVVNANVTGYGLMVGGLVGCNAGTVSNSYATGGVTGTGFGNGSVGGLVGVNNNGSVSNSYSTAVVTASDLAGVGGLVGINNGPVSNCYATGDVNGMEEVGGLMGWNWYGTVSNSYSIGSVMGNSYVGGLVGRNEYGTVINSFWDIETSGQNTSGGGTGKTTMEMRDVTTFSGVLWDITAVTNPAIRSLAYIWNIVDNVTYPFLSWQPVS
jgi:hypothetical protein